MIVALLLVFAFFTMFGDRGIFHLLRLKKEVVRIKDGNAKLEEENQRLKEEVKRLRQDKRYIEEIARKELGMVKEGETVYHFSNDKNTNVTNKNE